MSSTEGFTKLLDSGEDTEQDEGPVKSLLRQISSSSQQSLQVLHDTNMYQSFNHDVLL